MWWVQTAQAQWVDDLVESFDAFEADPHDGTDGWVAGYAGDGWTSLGIGGVAATDNFLTSNCPGGMGWGFGGCNSDYLVQSGRSWTDFRATATVRSDDDDAVGLVFRWTSDADFYVVFWTRDKCPRTANGGDIYDVPGSEARVYSIVGGVGREIARLSGATYDQGQVHALRVQAVGDQFDVWLDGDRNGTFEPSEQHFSFVDADHPNGSIGFWAWTAPSEFDDLVVEVPEPPPHTADTGLPAHTAHTGAPGGSGGPAGHSGAPHTAVDPGGPDDTAAGHSAGGAPAPGGSGGSGAATTDGPVLGAVPALPGDPGCGCGHVDRGPLGALLALAALSRLRTRASPRPSPS